MVCRMRLRQVDARPFLAWIVGALASLGFLADPALGEFAVQPILRKQQVAPGERGLPLGFKLENFGDVPTRVSLRLVELTRDPNGIWMEVDPNDWNAVASRSCKGWLTEPPADVELEPNQVLPIPLAADVPADAKGVYLAGLIAETLQKTADDGPYQGAFVQLQYLAPIILDVRASTTGAPTPTPQALSGRVVDPNGRPVAGARVILIRHRRGAAARRNAASEPRRPDDERKAKLAMTDADGRFRFEGTHRHSFHLFATHAMGLGVATGKAFQVNCEIRLEPWGRAVGQLARGRMAEPLIRTVRDALRQLHTSKQASEKEGQ